MRGIEVIDASEPVVIRPLQFPSHAVIECQPGTRLPLILRIHAPHRAALILRGGRYRERGGLR